MHEAEQHRQFIKRLHMLIHSHRDEDERAELAKAAVLAYAAALEEVAGSAPQGTLSETAYVELHLVKAHNWVLAWQSLSDPLDPATARVCDAASRALSDQRDQRHASAA